jgi:hypothetical protein
VVKKKKRADCPLKYEIGSLNVSKISAEIDGWYGEDTAGLSLNHGDARQFHTGSEEVTL